MAFGSRFSSFHFNLNLLINGTIVALCFTVVAALQIPQFSQLEQRLQMPSVDQLRRESEAEAIQLRLFQQSPSFGFDNLIADWVFLRFLQYFGDDAARMATDYQLSPEFFDVTINRDPRFLESYKFLSTSTAIYAGQPERSIALMNQGLKSLTPTVPQGSYLVWRNKGIDELLFLGDAQAARRSFETAADWAKLSGLPNREFAVAASQQMAQFIARNPASKIAQASAWVMVLTNAVDDRTRKTAIARIQTLGGKITQAPDGSFQIQLPTKD
jgi:hypothetical protein